MSISRRHFGLSLTAGLGASLAAPAIVHAQSSARVVVIGGGFGGATAARYLRAGANAPQVTLVEPSARFVTCPYSNLVLAGWRTMDQISHSYDILAKQTGVILARDRAVAVDPDKRLVRLAGGRELRYDKLVLSPGIDLKWNAIAGYDEAAAEIMPHAWRAGPQTVLLRRQLEAMPDGGLFVLAAPANPFRCPPGPYERVSVIAAYFKQNKPRSKILILDAKENFSKQPLFMDGWKALYGDMIEWVPLTKDGKVTEVDAASLTLECELGQRHKATVANVVPPQMAGAIAQQAGVADGSGWCPIVGNSFESTRVKNIHVVGDATIAAPMPKSGFAANNQGKVAARAIRRALAGQSMPEVTLSNTCYSHVGVDYAISVAGVYKGTAQGLTEIPNSGGVSGRDWGAEYRKLESSYADGWYAAISRDIWG